MRYATADIGGCRPVGTLIKENARTVLIRFNPEDHIKSWFDKESCERQGGLMRNGLVKRHKLKHGVIIV